MSAVPGLLLGLRAALAVTRFTFLGRKAFIVTILVVQMLPGEAPIISLYRMLDGWGQTNSILGWTAVYVAAVLPFTVWTLRGFVVGIPVELEEAAMVDGCSRLRHPSLGRARPRARPHEPAREPDPAPSGCARSAKSTAARTGAPSWLALP